MRAEQESTRTAESELTKTALEWLVVVGTMAAQLVLDGEQELRKPGLP